MSDLQVDGDGPRVHFALPALELMLQSQQHCGFVPLTQCEQVDSRGQRSLQPRELQTDRQTDFSCAPIYKNIPLKSRHLIAQTELKTTSLSLLSWELLKWEQGLKMQTRTKQKGQMWSKHRRQPTRQRRKTGSRLTSSTDLLSCLQHCSTW